MSAQFVTFNFSVCLKFFITKCQEKKKKRNLSYWKMEAGKSMGSYITLNFVNLLKSTVKIMSLDIGHIGSTRT